MSLCLILPSLGLSLNQTGASEPPVICLSTLHSAGVMAVFTGAGVVNSGPCASPSSPGSEFDVLFFSLVTHSAFRRVARSYPLLSPV